MEVTGIAWGAIAASTAVAGYVFRFPDVYERIIHPLFVRVMFVLIVGGLGGLVAGFFTQNALGEIIGADRKVEADAAVSVLFYYFLAVTSGLPLALMFLDLLYQWIAREGVEVRKKAKPDAE